MIKNIIKKGDLRMLLSNKIAREFMLNNIKCFNYKVKKVNKDIDANKNDSKNNKLDTSIITSSSISKTKDEYLKEITENSKEVSFLNKVSKSINTISNFKIALVGFSPFLVIFIAAAFEVGKILLIGQSDFLQFETNKVLMEKLNFNSLMFKLCLISNLSFNFFISGIKISQYTKDMKDRDIISYTEEGYDKGSFFKLLKGIKEFYPIFFMFVITFSIIKKKDLDYKYVSLLLITGFLNSYKINFDSITDLLKKLRVFNSVGSLFLISMFILNYYYSNKFKMNIMIDEEDEFSIKELISMKQILELEKNKIKNELDLILANEEACLNIYE